MDLDELAATDANINFIPCLAWVKTGVAKANPEKVQLTKEELVGIIKETKEKLQVAESEAGTSQSQNDDEFNLEKYDEEDDNTALEQLGIQTIADLPESAEDNFDDEDDSDKEDDIIKPNDNLLLIGRVFGDASMLEVYVHNEEEGSLYCHHDLLLPAFPLCIEWLDFEPDAPKGNYCAIGSMSPIIDIWDLDIINCLEPAYSLGKKGSRKKNIKKVGHSDAVLDISWNANYHHILASGSVDKTVILWDIETGIPSTKLSAFEEKVQCVKWHQTEAHFLLTGACDKTAKLFDCRVDEHKSWDLDGEAERVLWANNEEHIFYVGTNVGTLQCIDSRQGIMWSREAHEKEVTGLSFSSRCPGLLATTSADDSMKVWDVTSNEEPRLVHTKDMKMGMLHCLQMCPDSPFIFAAGGDNKSNNLTVADLMLYDPVKHHFSSRSLKPEKAEEDTMDTSNS